MKDIKYKDFHVQESLTFSDYVRRFIVVSRDIPLDSVAKILYKDIFGLPKFLGEYCGITNGADYFLSERNGIEYIEILKDFY